MSASADASTASTAGSGGLSLEKRWRVHDGELTVYKHASSSTGGSMSFAVFLPPSALHGGVSVPVVYWLSGLTCTWENFAQKSGAFEHAAALGVAIVAPDTSPRGHAAIEGEAASWDFGLGAGFYVDATAAPWSAHYRMYTYVSAELPAVVRAHLGSAIDDSRASVMGHSMGGLGALLCHLKNHGRYRACSAFAPISNPSCCAWGVKAFTHFFGGDAGTRASWDEYDPTALVAKSGGGSLGPIFIEQGLADTFYPAQLLPDNFVRAANAAGVAVTYAPREGYDHSYFFIATYIREHLVRHAALLKA